MPCFPPRGDGRVRGDFDGCGKEREEARMERKHAISDEELILTSVVIGVEPCGDAGGF